MSAVLGILRRMVVAFAACAIVVVCLVLDTAAQANTSHAGWPAIDGMLLMNKTDSDRPLDARPGQDPFDGTDPSYSCDAVHGMGGCASALVPGGGGWVVRPTIGHNELLGGNGNDVIHAGPAGDVIWGDYKPSGQPTSQRDLLYGGAGDDFIYASHGLNEIWTGAGNDHVFLVYGRGVVYCDGPGVKTLVVRRLPQNRHYLLRGCAGAIITYTG